MVVMHFSPRQWSGATGVRGVYASGPGYTPAILHPLVRVRVRVRVRGNNSIPDHPPYPPPPPRTDHPDSLDTALLIEHIKKLRSNQVAFVPTYDFATHCRTQELNTVHSRPVIIVEGILIFSNPELCDLLDLKIFVDTDDDVRLIRRIQRDTLERGRNLASVIGQYVSTVRPMYHKFVKDTMRNADMIVPHGINVRAHDLIVTKLKDFVANGYSAAPVEYC